MARPRRPSRGEHLPADLFSIDPTSYLPMALAGRPWPDPARFPVNHAGSHVRQQVWGDLVGSSDPVVIAGFSSIGELIDLAAAWAHRQHEGSLRVLLGSEPFATERSSFASAEAAFTEEVRKYWLEEHGISLRSSAKVVQTIELLDAARRWPTPGQSYSLLGSNETANWVAPGGAEQFLRDLSSSKLKGWAVTGSFAASQVVSVTAPEIAVVFAQDPERIAETMRLRPVRNGGNVVTALPYDRVVFERTWRADNIVYASLTQIVMDCITGFGRMPAEADALLDWMQRRTPRWQAPSLTAVATLP